MAFFCLIVELPSYWAETDMDIDMENTMDTKHMIEAFFIFLSPVTFFYKYSGENNFILSDMAFWNPSELIGDNPKPLSYTLFEDLITEYSWNKGIQKLGYTNIEKYLVYTSSKKLVHKV